MDDHRDTTDMEVDLNTCDMEPIHTPGTIQPFGALLAGPMDLSRIEFCSENVEAFFGQAPGNILGASFEAVFGADLVHDLRNLASQSTARYQRERLGTYTLPQGRFEIALHVNPNRQAIVEFEPCEAAANPQALSAVERMRKILSAASDRDTLQRLLEASVTGLSALTGFDRVMAYRYEPNGDGEVVAEHRATAATSFLGLRYPAWDVPEQARALQVRNPVRMLADVRQTPVRLMAHDPKAPPLDIALAHLRGISAIHVEYLQNMGVAATLTIGLVVDGKLWGMFACHHLSPRIITSDMRIAVELFGQMISLVIKQRLELEKTLRRHRAAEAREKILASTDAKTDLLNAFGDLAPILGEVIRCDGLAISYEGKILTHGSVPSHDAIAALCAFSPDREDVIHAVANLSECPLIHDQPLQASAGALLIRATAAFPMQLLFFRDEKIRTLKWAGRPEKEMAPGPFGARITPRGSFDAYLEAQRGCSDIWDEADRAAARELQILLTQITAKGERVQLLRHNDLVTHQRQQDLMIAELNHRVKNILALIRSLSRQAKASSASLDSYARALEQRIAALAAAHDLAVTNTMKGVSLRGVLETELGPYLRSGHEQVMLSGPLVGLRADVAPMVALVLHEVVTNAAKYGALSTDDGFVRVKWSVNAEGLAFSWREIGGPAVVPPERHGFGRTLIEKAIPFELDGTARIAFDADGVRFDFELPADTMVDLDGETEAKLVGQVAEIANVATGRRALLIEDNVVLAMDMVESLTRLGAETVETASSYPAGLKLAEKGGFDFAVLDLNLRGTVSFGIAEALRAAKVPFVFVTGYGSSIDLPAEFGDVPILTKPVDEGTLSRCLEAILA